MHLKEPLDTPSHPKTYPDSVSGLPKATELEEITTKQRIYFPSRVSWQFRPVSNSRAWRNAHQLIESTAVQNFAELLSNFRCKKKLFLEQLLGNVLRNYGKLSSILWKTASEGEREDEREVRETKIFSSSPTTTPLRWRSLSPLRFYILSAVLDGLWREKRGSVNRLFG